MHVSRHLLVCGERALIILRTSHAIVIGLHVALQFYERLTPLSTFSVRACTIVLTSQAAQKICTMVLKDFMNDSRCLEVVATRSHILRTPFIKFADSLTL